MLRGLAVARGDVGLGRVDVVEHVSDRRVEGGQPVLLDFVLRLGPPQVLEDVRSKLPAALQRLFVLLFRSKYT